MAVIKRDDLRNKLKKREIAPVYVLFGPETYLRDLAAKTIANLVFDDGSMRDFNENEYSLTQSENLGHALAAADQLPMMAPRRVVRISELRVSATGSKDTLKEDDHESMLRRYLERPSESTVVIFIADELDKRRKMSKLLFEHSCAVEFERLDDHDLIEWVKKEVRENGCTAEDKAIHYLVSLVGDNLRRLTSEVKKVATASLPEKVITYDIVHRLVSDSREMSNFNLTNHIFGKDKRKPLLTLKKLLDDGAEPLMLLGLLASNLRKTLATHEMMKQGASPSEVSRVMRLHPKHQSEFLEAARRSDPAKLRWMLERTAQTDIAIKTSRGGSGPAGSRLQIEMLVCEMIAR